MHPQIFVRNPVWKPAAAVGFPLGDGRPLHRLPPPFLLHQWHSSLVGQTGELNLFCVETCCLPGANQGCRSSLGEAARPNLPSAARAEGAGEFASCRLLWGKPLLPFSLLPSIIPLPSLHIIRSLCDARLRWGRCYLLLLPHSPHLPWSRSFTNHTCRTPSNNVHHWNDLRPSDNVQGKPKTPICHRLPRPGSDHDPPWSRRILSPFGHKSVPQLPTRLSPPVLWHRLWPWHWCHTIHTLRRAFPPPDALLWLWYCPCFQVNLVCWSLKLYMFQYRIYIHLCIPRAIQDSYDVSMLPYGDFGSQYGLVFFENLICYEGCIIVMHFLSHDSSVP